MKRTGFFSGGWWAAPLVFALLLAACGDGEGGTDDTASETTVSQNETTTTDSAPSTDEPTTTAGDEGLTDVSVIVPSSSIISFYQNYAALYYDSFENEGLNVAVNSVDGTGPALQALASGTGQVLELSTNSVMIGVTERDDFDAKMFYLVYGQSPFDVVVPEDSEIQSAEELEGRVIGVPALDDIGAITARALMSEFGFVEGEDYELFEVGESPGQVTAIEREDIDAFSGGPSEIGVLNARGYPTRSLSTEEFAGRVGFGYWALQETIEQDPEMLCAFSAAITSALQEVGTDPEAVVTVAEEFSPQEVQDRDLGIALAEVAIGLRSPVDVDDKGASTAEQWDRWTAAMIEQDLIPDDSTPDQFYTNDFIGC